MSYFEKEIMIKKKIKWTFIIFLLLIGRGIFAQNNNDKISDKETDTLKTKQIQEVLIKAQKKKQFSDHATILLIKRLLKKLGIPKICLPHCQNCNLILFLIQ